MRITQMVNCLAIAYIPYIVYYSRGGVTDCPEHNKLTFFGFGFYFLSQLTKICLIASGIFDLLGFYIFNDALVTNLTNIIDFYFLHQAILSKKLTRSERHLKTLPIGAGWALAEIIVNYTYSFIAGFKDKGFKMRYYFNAFEANSKILYSFISVSLVLHYIKSSSKPLSSMPLLLASILIHFFFVPYFKRSFAIGVEDTTIWEFIFLLISVCSDFAILFVIKYLNKQYDQNKKL